MKVFLRPKEVEDILLRKNKSKNWFAHKIEISNGYLSQLMDGSRRPSPRLRERIMANLPEYTFDQLFEIKGAD